MWSYPFGSFLTDFNNESVYIRFGPDAISDYISVRGVNACGMGLETKLNITVKKAEPPIISKQGHLSLIYDIVGDDMEYEVAGMAATKDSIYVISNTPDLRGKFYRIDQDGKGYKEIWKFDKLNYEPISLIGNDSVIYGSTRYGNGKNGGSIFRYSIKDHKFKIVKILSPSDVQSVILKNLTNSVIWFSSYNPGSDFGSISSIKPDGSDFKKVYSDFDLNKGCYPEDFAINNDSIYIACRDKIYNYNNQEKTYGCFSRVSLDGKGYKIIIDGSPERGSGPESIVIRENKIYGTFSDRPSFPRTPKLSIFQICFRWIFLQTNRRINGTLQEFYQLTA